MTWEPLKLIFINVLTNHRSDTSPGTAVIRLQSQTLLLEIHMENDVPLWVVSNKPGEELAMFYTAIQIDKGILTHSNHFDLSNFPTFRNRHTHMNIRKEELDF